MRLAICFVALGTGACSRPGTARSSPNTTAQLPQVTSAPTSAIDAKVCSLRDLAFDYYGGGAGAGNDFGTIRIRDVAARPCLLRDPVVVSGIDRTSRIVTQTVSYPVAAGLILTPFAHRVPPGKIAPPGSVIADLLMAASYRDDPASQDGICHARLVVPASWRLTLLHGVRTVANASYDPQDPHNRYASLLTCYGQIDTPDAIHADS
jgi:hypothetical protein